MAGPSPVYQPDFPSDFIKQAQSIVRQRTVEYQLRQRAMLVLLLHSNPLISNVAAAAQAQLHPNSVRLWRQRWAKGCFSIQDEPGRGRKPEFSPSG